MVGTWYGKIPLEGGGYHEWLDKRFSDGTYKIQFKSPEVDRIELGERGISGGVFFQYTKAK